MKKLEYTDFITKKADEQLDILNNNNYIDGGENGPYSDNETPVRLTAHWIYIYSWLYRKNGDDKYLSCVKKLAEYLFQQKINLSDDTYVFCSRNKKGKDHVNGTIGDAWIIEGLIEATKVLHDEKYYQLATKLFLSHPFNKKIGCWDRYEIDGRLLGYDETFNHQLWLAAAGGQILEYKENETIRKQVECFLDKTLNNKLFRIHKNGLIKHFSIITDSLRHRVGFIKNHLVKDYSKKHNLLYKEEGYHYFALYGFAILKNSFPEHKIFTSKKLQKAIEYAVKEENYIKQISRNPLEDGTGLAKKFNIDTNIYCFPYNSPAYELPYIIKKLKPEMYNKELIEQLWVRQKEVTLSNDGEYTNNVYDEKTLTARIYELLKSI